MALPQTVAAFHSLLCAHMQSYTLLSSLSIQEHGGMPYCKDCYYSRFGSVCHGFEGAISLQGRDHPVDKGLEKLLRLILMFFLLLVYNQACCIMPFEHRSLRTYITSIEQVGLQ